MNPSLMTHPGPTFADASYESLVESIPTMNPSLMTHPGLPFADAGYEFLVVSISPIPTMNLSLTTHPGPTYAEILLMPLETQHGDLRTRPQRRSCSLCRLLALVAAFTRLPFRLQACVPVFFFSVFPSLQQLLSVCCSSRSHCESHDSSSRQPPDEDYVPVFSVFVFSSLRQFLAAVPDVVAKTIP
jgi:hypothetical protein